MAVIPRRLDEAGFERVGLEVTRVYDARDAGLPAAAAPAGRLVSAFLRATKP